MKWIAIGDTVVDVERYRLFKRTSHIVVGLNEYVTSDALSTEAIAAFPSDEQAEKAFEEFVFTLESIKNE